MIFVKHKSVPESMENFSKINKRGGGGGGTTIRPLIVRESVETISPF